MNSLLRQMGFEHFCQVYFCYLFLKSEKSKKKPPVLNQRLFQKYGYGIDISSLSEKGKRTIIETVESYLEGYLPWKVKLIELVHTLPSYEAVSRWFCANGKEYTSAFKDLLNKRYTLPTRGSKIETVEALIEAEIMRHKKMLFPRELRNRQHVQKESKRIIENLDSIVSGEI